MSYECDCCFIPAHHQLSLLIDLANSHHLDHHILLRGSGLFLQDILSGTKLISPLQMQQVLQNAEHCFHSQDISFLFGQRTLITPFNEAIKAILYATTLREALSFYIEFSALVSPWLMPRMKISQDVIILYWLDENQPKNRFLIEICMSAIQALGRYLFEHKLEWQYEFNFSEPHYIEQYWTHLGSQLQFDRAINSMSLPVCYLDQTLPNKALTLSSISHQQALQHLQKWDLQQSFLESLYHYLMQNIRGSIQLETVAEHFDMSPATFKRRLKKHNTHFQAQVDQCRLHTAIILYRVNGFNTEQIANYLLINDPTNFRRAFKRWCGMSPQFS